MSAKRLQPFANIEMFLRMITNFARKTQFYYSHFTKLTKFALLCKKICIYQKKAVPLQQIPMGIVNLTYSRLGFIYK